MFLNARRIPDTPEDHCEGATRIRILVDGEGVGEIQVRSKDAGRVVGAINAALDLAAACHKATEIVEAAREKLSAAQNHTAYAYGRYEHDRD